MERLQLYFQMAKRKMAIGPLTIFHKSFKHVLKRLTKVETYKGVNMYKVLFLTLMVASSASMSQENLTKQDSAQAPSPMNAKQTAYAFGYEWGASVYEIRDELSMDDLLAGMNEAFNGKKSKLDVKTRKMAINQGIKKMRENRQRITRKLADEFIAENTTKKQIHTLKSGLQYEVLKKGPGPVAKMGERIKVHFTANSLMGVYVNDTYQNNKPISTKVGEGLPALTEVITKMPIGSKYKVYLHPELWSKYDVGSKGLSRNDVLIYEVEILSKLFDFDSVIK